MATPKKVRSNRSKRQSDTGILGSIHCPEDLASRAQHLMDKLPIGVSTLERDAIEQPQLYLEALELRLETSHRRTAMEMNRNQVKAEIEAAFRIQCESDGKRATERIVDNHLETHPDVQRATKRLWAATEVDEMAKALVDAYRMRKDMIRVASDLTSMDVRREEAMKLMTQENERLRTLAEKKYGKRQ